MFNTLSRRHRAGSRKNKRNRNVGSFGSDSAVKQDRRIGELQPHRLVRRPAPQPTLVVVEGMQDQDRIMSSDLLENLDEFMRTATIPEYVFERDDSLSGPAVRARISRAAKKHNRKVSVSLQGTYLTVYVGT